MKNKEKLLSMLEYMDEDQCEFLVGLLNASTKKTSAELIKLTDIKSYDSAMPQPMVNQIKEVYPNFSTQLCVMDYTDNPNGEIVSIANNIIYKLINKF